MYSVCRQQKRGHLKKNTSKGSDKTESSCFASLSDAQPTDEYVRVRDGHLFIGDKRVRFWGAIGTFPGPSYAANEETVRRLSGLGFNMVRFWQAPGLYVKGDGSQGDLTDHFLWCLKQAGMRVWYAGLNRLGTVSENDVDILYDKSSAEQWKKAVGELKNKALRNNLARHWDERLHRLSIKRMTEIAHHVNQYTGMAYADDPLFAIWELSNEEWWFHHMKLGNFLRGDVPSFFLQKLSALWNHFLAAKYGSDDRLREAWYGNVLPGESLAARNILMLPMLGDVTDLQAASLGVNVAARGVKQSYSRTAFNGARGADVIEFLLSVWIGSKKEEAEAVKACGKSLALAPLVWDTGIGYDLQTQYFQQHADAIAHDSYWNAGIQLDPHHRRFPWMSLLEQPPRTGWDHPWLEHNKMEGKPFFVYETQIINPAKYRAEYPMLIACLGAIQDWDAVCWHYWGHPRDVDDPRPYDQPLDYVTRDHYPQGYHYQFDEVQQSAMTAAAEIFKHGLLKPAPHPTKYTFGRKSLYSWEMNSYGDVGRSFVPTTYRYGMRLLIDPTVEEDSICGPYFIDRGIYEPCPIKPTDKICIDWLSGNLVFDAPAVAMFVGFLAQRQGGDTVSFSNGVRLRNVVIVNPPRMPYPVRDDEKFIEFCVTSTDGRPLKKTKRAIVSLVSTSFNSGFKMDNTKRPFHIANQWFIDHNHLEPGKLPVLTARVAAKIDLPMFEGATYRLIDWHLRVIGENVLKEGILTLSAKAPVFLVELTRK